jgi:hypothetical protein
MESSSARVEQSPDGTWSVVRAGQVIASGLSNASAWREADRLDNEAVGI